MANYMRLTLQLNAVDNMSKVVQGAAMASKRSLDSVVANSQRRAAEARSNMLESGMLAAGGAAALAYPLKMAGNYERLRVSMIALTGSSSEGIAAYKDVVKLASETPLALEDVARNVVMMIGYGQAAKEASKSVKMLGDITALTNGDMGNAIVAYGQARQEGKMLTRDLRQFINAGVPIISILKQQLGANADIFKMAEEGAITFDLLENALLRSTQAGGQFANGLQKLSATGPGLWVRLTDEVGRFAAVFGDALLPAMKSFGEWLIPIIKDTGAWFKQNQLLSQGIMALIVGFTTLATAGLVLNGVIWLSTTAFTGYLSVITWTGWQTIWASNVTWTFRILLWGIQFAAVGAMKGLLAMGRGLIFTVIPAIWGAVTSTGFWVAALGALELALFPVLAIGAGVAALVGVFILLSKTIQNWDAISDFFSNMWGNFKEFLVRAKTWGSDLISSIVDGIKLAAPMLFSAIDSAMTFARGFFPASPAKRGAFKDIQRIKIIEQVAKNIKPNSLAPAMAAATDGGVSAIGTGSGGSLGIGASGVGGSVMVTYSPTITIGSGVSKDDKESFTALLDRHKTEIARMVQEATRSQNRKSFA